MLNNSLFSRWGASASEVIFVNRPLATFWSLGKVEDILIINDCHCSSRLCQLSADGEFTSLP